VVEVMDAERLRVDTEDEETEFERDVRRCCGAPTELAVELL
jgi:hypothetical protein